MTSHVANAFWAFLGMSNLLNAGVHATIGIMKNSESNGEITAATKNVILNSKPLSTGGMMKLLLEKNFGSNGRANALFEKLVSQGLLVNGEINYRDCSGFEEANLKGKSDESRVEEYSLAKHSNALLGNCKKIGQLLLNPGSHDGLKKMFVGLLKDLKIGIQKQEILGPAAQALAGQLGQVVGDKFTQFISKKAEQRNQAGRKTIDEKKVAQESGLNKNPETGPKGSGRKVLIANDPNNVAEGRGGIRTKGWNEGISEGQNVRYISGTTLAEFDGRTYAISYEGVEVLSADGSTVVRQAAQVQGAEIKTGLRISSLGNSEGSEAAHRFTATIEQDLAKNTQKQVLTEWTSSDTGHSLNWAGVLS